jgi:hypothetical protein
MNRATTIRRSGREHRTVTRGRVWCHPRRPCLRLPTATGLHVMP